MMDVNEYQKKAMATCMPTCENITYMLCNLVAEVGEFSGKIAKHIRKDEMAILKNQLTSGMPFKRNEEAMEELKKEAGDIAWQLAGLCAVMGWSLEDVCQANLDKLASRKQRGVIDGNGDNR